MLQRELESLGLSAKEAKVYLAALELGATSVQNIAKKAGVNRATTYTNIDALMEMGLMSSYKEGKKFHFFAEKPSKIVNILVKRQQHELEARERELERAVPELKALQARRHSTPVVKYYSGKDGVKKLAKKRLEQMDATDKEEVSRHIYSEEVVSSIFSKNELEKINHNILKSDGRSKALVVRDREGYKPKREEDIYITSNELSMNCDISIHKDEVHIISFADPVSGISIKDPHISETLTKVFDFLTELIPHDKGLPEGVQVRKASKK